MFDDLVKLLTLVSKQIYNITHSFRNLFCTMYSMGIYFRHSSLGRQWNITFFHRFYYIHKKNSLEKACRFWDYMGTIGGQMSKYTDDFIT